MAEWKVHQFPPPTIGESLGLRFYFVVVRTVTGAQLMLVEFVECRISGFNAIDGFHVSFSWVFRNAFSSFLPPSFIFLSLSFFLSFKIYML